MAIKTKNKMTKLNKNIYCKNVQSQFSSQAVLNEFLLASCILSFVNTVNQATSAHPFLFTDDKCYYSVYLSIDNVSPRRTDKKGIDDN